MKFGEFRRKRCLKQIVDRRTMDIRGSQKLTVQVSCKKNNIFVHIYFDVGNLTSLLKTIFTMDQTWACFVCLFFVVVFFFRYDLGFFYQHGRGARDLLRHRINSEGAAILKLRWYNFHQLCIYLRGIYKQDMMSE